MRVSNAVSHEDSRTATAAITGFGPPGYQVWAFSKGLADLSPDADPDEDGMNNLTEYAFNTDPRTHSVSPAPAGRIDLSYPTPYLEMTVRQRRDSGLSISYESSTDLKAWSSSRPIPQVGHPDVDGDGTTELINVFLPLGPAGTGFLRVKITDP